MSTPKVALLILDGWGIAENEAVSAIAKANTPFIDSLYQKYPNSQLEASGLSVGLPEGQMGNSEVGHMNLGAGRIVYQDLVKINRAVKDNSLASEPALLEAFEYAKKENKKVHLMGLLSDGGVHAHIDHLKCLCTAAANHNLKQVYIHAFTDGRDTDPKGGINYIADLEDHLSHTGAKIASVIGRYYAMDRDQRWERVKKAYDLLINGKGTSFKTASAALESAYASGTTDEFIEPAVIELSDGKNGQIEAGDVVICFNFRTDRGRQITQVLTQRDFPDYDMQKLPLHYVTLTRYDETFENIQVVFEKDNLTETLGEVLSKAGKKQIRIAETEKYPHVTFFFSGGREQPFEGEKRLLCASPKVATYDLQPEMSAFDIRDKIIPEMEARSTDFICLNFANPDMVGHTGVMEAAVTACETVDTCTKDVVEAGLKAGYQFIILADHGNSDRMVNPDGTPNTAHTTQPVPCFLLSDSFTGKLKNGVLGDVAPTILKLMGLEAPSEMKGNALL
jgi:2,3-bisphosphoglycerate-independent phosphoglycerate mutase